MALTTSEILEPGAMMPGFSLPDVVTGQIVGPDAFSGSKASVVIVLCRHCPYVVHVMPEIVRVAGDYLPRGTAFVGISANDASSYPDDAPDRLAAMVAEQHIPFPILHDESKDTVRSFHAVCTPEFFVFDGARRLFYHGRLDGSTPGNNVPCNGADLRQALDAVLSGAPPLRRNSRVWGATSSGSDRSGRTARDAPVVRRTESSSHAPPWRLPPALWPPPAFRRELGSRRSQLLRLFLPCHGLHAGSIRKRRPASLRGNPLSAGIPHGRRMP